MIAGNWYYGSPINGLLYTNLHTINEVQYYFDEDGVMKTNDVVVNGKVLMIDESGAVIGTKAIEDGWSQYDGEWYYYQNKKPYTGWVGTYYIYNGEMCRDSEILWQDKSYYIGEDGAYLTNAWIKDGMYYAKADGTYAEDEWLEINGAFYYFDIWGHKEKYSRSSETYNGAFASDGAYIAPDGYAQGWALIDGSYYYKEGARFINNQIKKINGNWYYFDDESQAASGWKTINGVRYYFGRADHIMYTGYHVINKILYYFDANGACQGIYGPQNGWYQADGNWYYIRGGRALTSEKTVTNNAWYEFDENGIWVTE